MLDVSLDERAEDPPISFRQLRMTVHSRFSSLKTRVLNHYNPMREASVAALDRPAAIIAVRS